MAENKLSTLPRTNEDDNHSNKDTKRNNSSPSVNKSSDETIKRPKSSFLSNLRKKFSFQKKVKSKDLAISNDNNKTPVKQSNQLNDCKSDKSHANDAGKQNNRLSAFRKSVGKDKENFNSDNVEISKHGETGHNDSRPLSMHIANSFPPRNGYLASFGWYWGPLSRSEATHRLRHQDDGSFLVRDSEGDPNKFTLSFKGSGQIFHNRILQHQHKYAFLPDEEFDSIPDLILDAMRRSATSAYCFSRSTDVASTVPTSGTTEAHNPSDVGGTGTTTSNGTVGTVSTLHKHEVRLLRPVSRFSDGPRSLKYLCRFMIRQYTKYQDLCTLISTPDIISYLQDPKYNI